MRRDEARATGRPTPGARRLAAGHPDVQRTEEAKVRALCLAAAASSRWEPLGVVLRSRSAAGKPSLMDVVLSLVPEGDRLKLSALVRKES